VNRLKQLPIIKEIHKVSSNGIILAIGKKNSIMIFINAGKVKAIIRYSLFEMYNLLFY